jgi:hypothetical protein
MRRFTRGNDSWIDLRDILSKYEEFTNSTKSFRGESGFWDRLSTINPGHQDESERQQMLYARDQMGLRYIVWSYQTPIAWCRADGLWIVTTRNYTKTTAKHLGKLRTAIADLRSTWLAA